jgi:hypothetical protein
VKALAKHFGANLYIMDEAVNEPSKTSSYAASPAIRSLLEEMMPPQFAEPLRIFKRGDQVRYIGYGNTMSNRLLRSLHARSAAVHGAAAPVSLATTEPADKNRR